MNSVSRPNLEHPQRLIIILAALQAFGPLSIDLYLPGLPAIAEDLSASAAQIQMTISIYLIGFFIGMLLYGPLSDKIGRRPLLLSGISLYILVSLGCAFANEASQLILLRLAQALGGSAAAVLGRAIVRDLFPLNEAARVLSLMHLVTMIATLIAPILGSYLMLTLGWRALFLALMSYASIVLLLVLWKIPETHANASRNTRMLKVFAAYGQIARHRGALGYVLCMSLSFAGMFAFITASPFVYIDYFGITPDHYALLFSLNIAGVILGVLLNARFVRRLGPQRILFAGATLAALSGVVLMVGGLFTLGGLPLIALALLGFVGVTGILGANCMASLLSHFPHQAGAAAGFATATQFGLGAVASILTGALHDGTPLPMTLLIGLCGIGSLLALRLTHKSASVAGEPSPPAKSHTTAQ